MVTDEKRIDRLARQLHDWYLEAVKSLDQKSYNKEAAKPYGDLTKDQKSIDIFIAKKLIQEVEKWQQKTTK